MELKKGTQGAEQLVFVSEILERREEHWVGNSEERGWRVPLRSRTCGKGSRELAGPFHAWEEPRKASAAAEKHILVGVTLCARKKRDKRGLRRVC